MPGETISAFAERHNIFVWDVFRLNSSLLRHGVQNVLPRYSGNLLAPDDHCLEARQILDRAVDEASWRAEVPSQGQPWHPDKVMQDRIAADIGPLVLDRRLPQFPPAFYSSKRHHADLNTTGWRKSPGRLCHLLEPPVLALYIVGHAADLRLNDMLTSLHIPMQAVCRCVLHCKLAIIKYEPPSDSWLSCTNLLSSCVEPTTPVL